MENTNCLQGMRCPKCKSEEPFRIEIKTLMTVYDNGTEDHADTDWDDSSYCECTGCVYVGKVRDFQISHQECQLVCKTEKSELPLLMGHLESKKGLAALERRLKNG